LQNSYILSRRTMIEVSMKAGTIVLIAASAALLCAISGCVSSSAPTDDGTLTGNVTVGPLTPVERVGVSPTPPPPEVFTSRHLIVYEADGTTKVADVPIRAAGLHGMYSVSLPPGTYVLDAPHAGVGHASPLPLAVTIESGKTTTVDVDIDTGIR
jgi:hypothetical protein